MAQFAPALEKTLKAEGGLYHAPKSGEWANYGISHWFLRDIGLSGLPKKTPRSTPATPDEITSIKQMTAEFAADLYRNHFWIRNRCGQLADQALADKLFDLSVNCGTGTAAKFLQRAVNAMAWPGVGELAVDGAIGPKTIAAANLCDAHQLLAHLRREAREYYEDLAASKPEIHAGNLKGWLKRLEA